jgi:hypothetical protein
LCRFIAFEVRLSRFSEFHYVTNSWAASDRQIQPFAETLDIIRLTVASIYFVCMELLVYLFAMHTGTGAIVSNFFASASLAEMIYTTFLIGHYLAIAVVTLDDLLFFHRAISTMVGTCDGWAAGTLAVGHNRSCPHLPALYLERGGVGRPKLD